MSAPATVAEALRVEVAARRGLDSKAASFLDGSTLEQLEAQADALVELLGQAQARAEQEPAPALDVFTVAAAEKARRKRELAAMFSGRSPQSRDQLGRYASLDGGARRPVPARCDPEREHGEVIGALVRAARWYRESF